MIAFDLAYELTLGAACALLDRPSPITGEAFRDGLLISAFVYVPLCVAGFTAFPGWQSMYLLPLTPFSSACFAAVMTASLFAFFHLGFHAASAALHLTRGRSRLLLTSLLLAWLSLLAFLFGAIPSRALWITTYQTFHTSPPPPLTWASPGALLGGPAMYFLLASTAANASSLLWFLARARRRRASPAS